MVNISNRHKDKNTNISDIGLLVEQRPLQIDNIPMTNSPRKILSRKKGNKVNWRGKVHDNSPNVLLVY